jgi:uridylate kinase
MAKRTIIRLGGSLISTTPGQLNEDYLSGFRDSLVRRHRETGEEFVVICGGGRLSRAYQDAVKRLRPDVSRTDLDWVGIFTCNLNAQAVRALFPVEITYPSVVTHLESISTVVAPIVIVGVEEPGHSSNYDAVEIARLLEATTILNLSNIEFIYDSDPRTNPEAKKYESVTWQEYLGFVPEEWHPGLSTPFDPVSSRRAHELGLEVVFMKGDNLENFEHYLETGECTGSIIKD